MELIFFTTFSTSDSRSGGLKPNTLVLMNLSGTAEFMSKHDVVYEQLGESSVVGTLHGCAGTLTRKARGIQVLADLAISSLKVGSLFRMIHWQVQCSS